MNKQELTARSDDSLSASQNLTKEKIKSRAINIQETNLYMLFNIERHQDPESHEMDTRHHYSDMGYDKGASALELVWEFAIVLERYVGAE